MIDWRLSTIRRKVFVGPAMSVLPAMRALDGGRRATTS